MRSLAESLWPKCCVAEVLSIVLFENRFCLSFGGWFVVGLNVSAPGCLK